MSETTIDAGAVQRDTGRADTGRADTRGRIVAAAADLLRGEGPGAVTTRGVAARAGVQAPTIYRLFGDKDGLLDAVAEHVMATFVAAKSAIVAAAEADDVDPLVDLRAGWDSQIEFGLANPMLFRMLSDPSRVVSSPAAVAGLTVLRARIHRVALAARLRVSEERAVAVVQAAGIGAIQTLLATPSEERDAGLADAMYEAVLRQVLVAGPGSAHGEATGPSGDDAREGGAWGGQAHGGAARGDGGRGDGARGSGTAGHDTRAAVVVAFRAVAPTLDALTAAERSLLADWLDRVVASDFRAGGDSAGSGDPGPGTGTGMGTGTGTGTGTT